MPKVSLNFGPNIFKNNLQWLSGVFMYAKSIWSKKDLELFITFLWVLGIVYCIPNTAGEICDLTQFIHFTDERASVAFNSWDI